MNNDFLLHESTAKEIDAFLTKPSHALIIEGKTGMGKRSVANKIAAELLKKSISDLTNYPQLLVIEPVNTSISISEIRRAQQFLKLKTTGQAEIRRILVVEKAELMTIEAQNAFLKILEEPPSDTVIFMLTSQKIKLLPTIRSRAQNLSVRTINKDKIIQHFSTLGHAQSAIERAYHVSNARIGLMSSMLNDDQSDHLTSIDQAKKLLSMSKFQRIVAVDELSKNKEALPDLLEALIIISQAALEQTLNRNNTKQAKSWHKTLGLATKAEQQLPSNPNTKLLMTDLLLNL